jgi:hypothetical protein
MNEILEDARTAAIQATLESLTKIVKDETAPVAERLKAAKVIDGISDSIMHIELVNKSLDSNDRSKRKMIDQLDKLHKKDEE